MHLCSSRDTEEKTRNGERAPLWTSRASRRPKRSPASSSFPFLRSLPFGESRYSRQQGRGPKVKDQSFLLFIRGSWLRNCHDTFSPVSSYPFLFLLPLATPFVIVFSFSSLFYTAPAVSCCCCCFYRPQPFFHVRCITSALPTATFLSPSLFSSLVLSLCLFLSLSLPLSLSLSLSLSVYFSVCFSALWLLSQRTRTCSFRPEHPFFLPTTELLHAG